MKTILMLAVMAATGMVSVAVAETATSNNPHGIWHRFAAYDLGNVRPQSVTQPSPTTVRK